MTLILRLDCCSLNERLSFLKYGPGNYFRSHCDGMLELPDGRKSLVTVQIYLGDVGCEGGATRFWSSDLKRYTDIEPKLGRVLIFQQRGLLHSGQDVISGTKYALRSDFMFKKERSEDEDVEMGT
jgi:Rps23 Pro-64 3,4-dihydroxylase Tpa1-like proline 4-hydroxylase